ncbi:hypothetical protein [Aureivirga sp. CE67]|uniref:hypothetical protein n=1 Tax=Aureivirga sp. CE67 TaxID=1788983 RepID=UPI0018CA8BE2|nr:hypothetical protein [Aureivirga sp. CE67]
MNDPYKNASAVSLFIRFTLIFLVVVTIIRLLSAMVFKGGFDGMINEYFADGKWKYFARNQAIFSLFYGAFMTGYYKFFKAKGNK